MTEAPKNITVLGGGIVGMMACLQLQRKGWQVTVIDRLEPGTPGQTSWGNAGSISVGNVTPLGKPGFLFDGLSKAISPNSPLLMPFSYLHRSLPWVLKVLRQSNKEKADSISRDIGALNILSGETWTGLLDDWDIRQFVANNGWLKLYENERSFKKTAHECRLMEEMDIPFQVMDRKDISDHEPELAPMFVGAILQKSSLGINSPGRLLGHLTDLARAQGAQIVRADIKAVRKAGDDFILVAQAAEHRTSRLLLASGAWSAKMAAMLGHDFPLETERGYHLFFDKHVPLKGPTINMDRYVAMSPVEGGVRVTSCVELGGLERAPQYDRMHRLSRFARKALPQLNACEGKEWMGYRPSLPDSKPVIGGSDSHKGLYFAFGNGHLGMTQAAGTGQLIAEHINREPTAIPLEPFAPNRFGQKGTAARSGIAGAST